MSVAVFSHDLPNLEAPRRLSFAAALLLAAALSAGLWTLIAMAARAALEM